MKSHEKYVKLISFGPFVALIGSLLIGSPQSFAENAESSPSEPLRLTVAPHTSSRIAMKTLPKAVCVLHVDGDLGNSHPLKLFSDDEGMIRFNVNPRAESDEVAAFAVDCTSDSESQRFGLELRPNHNPSLDMPAPAAEKRTPKASDFIRPALTQAEVLQLSDEELAKREYPRRPNREQAPAAFATWLKAVTQPARRINPRQAAHPELGASSNWELLTNWSGFELQAGPCSECGPYDAVVGEWYVPQVRISDNGLHTFSSFWIGLDGDGLSDLWQAGLSKISRTTLGRSLASTLVRMMRGLSSFPFSQRRRYYPISTCRPATRCSAQCGSAIRTTLQRYPMKCTVSHLSKTSPRASTRSSPSAWGTWSMGSARLTTKL